MKKCLLLILALLVLCGCGGTGEPEVSSAPVPTVTATPEPTPVPLDEPLEFNLPGELTDGDRETWVGGAIPLRHEERKIGAIYIEWGYTPGQWSFTADGETVVAGLSGYLHEYILLDEPVTEILIDALAPVCELYAFEAGAEPPDWVQVWQEPLEQADLLLMPTHADDEHVFFGGMMPYYAGQLGYKVQVVYLTNHWGQTVRPHELLDGLWTAGIRNYPVISGFPDQWAYGVEEAKEIYDYVDIVGYLVENIRRFKPSVIVGHDLNGEYGHGVHMLNAWGLTEAVEYAADAGLWPESAAQYGTWDTPKLYLHLYPNNEIIMDWSVPLSSFGGKTAFEVAVEGFACHVTQQGAFHVYGEGEEYDSRRFGLYRSLVGEDVVGGDVFENID